MVSELINMFALLKYAVAFVLCFTGGKLMLSGFFVIPDWITAAVMFATFVVSCVASLLVGAESSGEEGNSKAAAGPGEKEGRVAGGKMAPLVLCPAIFAFAFAVSTTSRGKIAFATYSS